MSDFIYDNVSIPTKTNARALTVVDSKGFQASDWTLLRSALLDTRTSILTGQFHGFDPRDTGEITALSMASTYRVAVRDSDKHLVYWDGTTLKDLLVPTGGGAGHVIRVELPTPEDLPGRSILHFSADFEGEDGEDDDTEISLSDTGITAAAYTYASVTVDAKGRITLASSGATPALASRTLTMSNTDLTIDSGSSADLSSNRTLALASTLAAKTIKGLIVAPDAATGSPSPVVTITPPAHTALTASTARPWVTASAQTWTWATGNIDDQHFVEFLAPTIAFAGASTVTRAVSIYATAPLAGTNATLTTSAAAVFCAPVATSYSVIFDKDVAAGTLKYASFTRQDVERAWIGLNASDQLRIRGTASGGGVALVSTSASGEISCDDVLGSRVLYGGNYMLVGPANITFGVAAVTGKIGYLNISPSAAHDFGTFVNTTGTPYGFLFTGAAHTGQTASTEVSQVDWNISQTYTWAAGALTTQRFFRVRRPTVAFASASTLTTAYTTYIDGAPAEGSNATLTKAWALGVVATSAQSSGSPGLLQVKGAAHTGLRTTVENTLVDLDIAQTYTWAAGTVANQRFIRIRQPTIAFASASTATKAATLWIDGGPVQGTNATVTEAWSLYVDDAVSINAGGSAFFSNVINCGPFANLTDYGQVQIRTILASYPMLTLDTGAHTGGVGGDFGGGSAATAKLVSFQRENSEKVQIELSSTNVLKFKTPNGTVLSMDDSGSVPRLGFFGTAPVAIQGTDTTLTNSVTSGGTDNTISDITDISTYSNAGAGAAIRNAIYQLARKVRLIELGIKTPGLVGN